MKDIATLFLVLIPSASASMMHTHIKFAIPLFLSFIFVAQGAIAQATSETGKSTTGTPPADENIDSVNVDANKIPLDHSIHSFVNSYVVPTMKTGKIARWRRGICPISVGLKEEFNIAIAVRLRQVAEQVGAPVDTDESCNANVRIIFTRAPQAVLDDMVKNHPQMLGYHDVTKIKSITNMSYPIQAWYATETRDNNGVLTLDSADHPFCSTQYQADLKVGMTVRNGAITYSSTAINNYVQDLYQYCGGAQVTGNRLNDGLRSEFNTVTVIADFNKLNNFGISSIADYVTMLVLSQTESFEACENIPTITNVMTANCDPSRKPNTLSESDLAYLKALYKTNPDVTLNGQITEIAHQMEDTLQEH